MKKVYLFLFIFSLIPKILYLAHEDYGMKGLYDVYSHLEYIKYVSSNFSLPHPDACWECHQQPVYYITAGILYKTANSLGISDDFLVARILQIYSLLIFSLFLIVGIMIIRLILIDNKAIFGISLLLFWPSGVIHSVRIGNDILIYLFISLSFYFLFKWWKNNKVLEFNKSLFFMLIGLLTKLNGLIMTSVLITSCFLKYYTRKKYDKAISNFIIIFLLTVVVLIIGQRDGISGNKRFDLLILNFKPINEATIVDNRLINFTFFDIKSYFAYPNINPSDDLEGRQYFWNYLLKTSLFGEFYISNKIQICIANILSILLLGLIAFGLIKFFSLTKSEIRQNFPILLSIFLFLAAIILLRIKYPCAGCNDFRYIYPILIPLVILIAQSYSIFRKNSISKYLYLFWTGIFIIFSFIFHLIPVFIQTPESLFFIK